jgi:hypothetical protein
VPEMSPTFSSSVSLASSSLRRAEFMLSFWIVERCRSN